MIPCAFCRHVVGYKLPPVMVQMMSQGVRADAMQPPEYLLDGVLK